MTSETRDFPGLPPFPKDVATAPLLALSLKKLLAKDEDEVGRLMEAAQDLGFFYLDLQDAGPTSAILDQVDGLFKISKEFYALPIEEKKRYDFSADNSYFGYKEQGAVVVDKAGTRDRNESYNVPKIDMLGLIDPLPRPEPFERDREVFASFMKTAHSIVTLLLDLFNVRLGLPAGTLAALHQIDAMSGDAVRLIKALPQPVEDRVKGRITLPEHTDYGSITFVFNQLGGLQVLPPGKDATYLYVEPLPGHMIVNIGDALVKFTNGLFRSNIHRIVAPPGAQGDFTRYSVVYFSRPDDDVQLQRLEGSDKIPPLPRDTVEEVITSKDWILRRALGRRATQAVVDLDKCAGTENVSRRIHA